MPRGEPRLYYFETCRNTSSANSYSNGHRKRRPVSTHNTITAKNFSMLAKLRGHHKQKPSSFGHSHSGRQFYASHGPTNTHNSQTTHNVKQSLYVACLLTGSMQQSYP